MTLTSERGVKFCPAPERNRLCCRRIIVEAFRASGAGWQSRMNDVLRKAVGA